MQLLRMAFRNVFRNKRRTWLTASVISVGIIGMITFSSMMDGSSDQTIENTIRLQTGHVKIHAPGYEEQKRTLPLDIAINDPNGITAQIEKMPEVKFVTQHIQFGGMVSNNGRALSLMVQAVEPTRESKLNYLNQKIVEGQYLTGGNQILVGKALADELGIKVGGNLSLVATTAQGAMNAADLEIVGIYNTNFQQFEQNTVIMPLDGAQSLLNMQNQATDLTVFLKNRQDSELVQTKINTLGPLEVQTWQQANADLLGMLKTKTKGTGIMVGILFLIAIFSIINTMLMSVTERTREIGTMMAMGTYRREIIHLFLCEGGVLGILGGTIGVTVGGFFAWYLTNIGIRMAGMNTVNIPIGDVLYGSFSWSTIIQSFLVGVVIATLSAAYPAWMASKMKPIEALRHV